MCYSKQQICEKFAPSFSWSEIEKDQYKKFNIADIEGAKVLSCYGVSHIKENVNTVTLYDYGKTVEIAKNGKEQKFDFVETMQQELNYLKQSKESQQEFGIVPLAFEKEDNFALSIIKTTKNSNINIVDIFFERENNAYCYHTFLPKEEKDFSISSLSFKYPHLKYIFKNLNEN